METHAGSWMKNHTPKTRKTEEHLSKGTVEKPTLTFELVSQFFYMPINQAARELNAGLTVLKKRCMELGIRRWPGRKVKSLHKLIDDVKPFCFCRGNGFGDGYWQQGEIETVLTVPDTSLLAYASTLTQSLHISDVDLPGTQGMLNLLYNANPQEI